ncbi:hypothetical protein Q5424_10580 [Conexibacter sp. JD483]|uniref:hypothetical protein n=1 Tax=unclassified Conexibacter TaxID=2627773 RepID=UPI00271DB0F2|nr:MULTISPECIES: hypothetical protein [unclassified Conexibacter]MDO8187490.1 hypothetical protein [Conexibacter sp. CPCC 205706]MDO8199267.1 hypothetical protein [Conexibacter sp. CPCC 205762]MDR9369528.1 hypothetical protein [Conexibacter sp. JD483]
MSSELEEAVIYRLMGLLHTRIGLALNGERMTQVRRGERGQGTVEYVALILLVAALLAGVVAATKRSSIGDGGIAKAIVDKIKTAISGLR